MSKRSEHVFQFTSKDVAAAASDRARFHKERLAFWLGEREKAVAQAKAKGVEVREYDVTGGKRAEIVIDPTVQLRISECASKIASHEQKLNVYRVEARTYGSQAPDRVYELDGEDVVHFDLPWSAGERVDG